MINEGFIYDFIYYIYVYWNIYGRFTISKFNDYIPLIKELNIVSNERKKENLSNSMLFISKKKVVKLLMKLFLNNTPPLRALYSLLYLPKMEGIESHLIWQ